MRPNFNALRYGLAWGCAIASWLVLGADLRADDGKQEPDPKVLIAELASPEFEARRIAQEQLQNLGLAAFDALLDAQFHADVEVAHRARFILRSMAIEWVKESDPKDVKLILRGYGKSDPIDRRSLIEALAQLEEQRGVAALCRLSNYEFDPVLSKYAALKIMQMDFSDSPSSREQVIRAIAIHGRPSGRPSSKWLDAYAKWLVAPKETLPVWKQLVEDEREQFESASPSTSREMAGLLTIWYADALRSQSQHEEATSALRQSLAYIEADERQVRDAAMELIERDAHGVVDELASRFTELFNNNPYLCYLHAESLQSRQLPAGAAAPLEKIDALVNRAVELGGERYFVHKDLAQFLKARGQFAWWEKESRIVISQVPPLSDEDIDTRNDLAELLGELERFDEAIEVMKPIAEEFSKGTDGDRQADILMARYHLLRARSAAQKRQFAEQKTALKAAAEYNMEDSDVLIDMFRAQEADSSWKELTQNYINSASKKFEDKLKEYEGELGDAQGNELFRMDTNTRIAFTDNQYAWLIANTTGDFDAALARSKQSLELRGPLSTYQDTLARCYYAKGDYANAVKYQRLAVKQEPHAPAMKRQLALFESALKNSSNKSTPAANDQ